jgi:hypothetical protein
VSGRVKNLHFAILRPSLVANIVEASDQDECGRHGWCVEYIADLDLYSLLVLWQTQRERATTYAFEDGLIGCVDWYGEHRAVLGQHMAVWRHVFGCAGVDDVEFPLDVGGETLHKRVGGSSLRSRAGVSTELQLINVDSAGTPATAVQAVAEDALSWACAEPATAAFPVVTSAGFLLSFAFFGIAEFACCERLRFGNGQSLLR